MIQSLLELPALTRSWLSGIEGEEFYDELTQSIVIDPPGASLGETLPADVDDVMNAVDLRGTEIGTFYFAPVTGENAISQIHAYDQMVRQYCDAPSEWVFLGNYGSGNVFASPYGVGLLDTDNERTILLAPDFMKFVLVGANAYDAYKRHIVRVHG